MNTNIITPPIWLQLGEEERSILRELLKIPRSGGRIVEDNRLVSDGCIQNDLNVITLERLQTALDSAETNFFSLWTQAVEQAATIAKEKVSLREREAQQQLDSQMVVDAEEKAKVFVAQIKRMPVMIQFSVYSQLQELLFPIQLNLDVKETQLNKDTEVKEPVITEDIKNIIENEQHEQTEGASNVEGNEGAGKGSKETKGTGKK